MVVIRAEMCIRDRHIGGDEVKYDQWNASVAISNYIKKLGVANPAELQIEFTNALNNCHQTEHNSHRSGGTGTQLADEPGIHHIRCV